MIHDSNSANPVILGASVALALLNRFIVTGRQPPFISVRFTGTNLHRCDFSPPQSVNTSPCAPAEARRWIFFWFFAGKFGKFSGKFGGNFAGFFLTHRTKAQKFRGKFRSIFCNKIRSSKKIFRAKFTLQTCHLNKYGTESWAELLGASAIFVSQEGSLGQRGFKFASFAPGFSLKWPGMKAILSLMEQTSQIRYCFIRSFEQWLVDRGGWREEIHPVAEIQASFPHPFTYLPLKSKRTQFWGTLFSVFSSGSGKPNRRKWGSRTFREGVPFACKCETETQYYQEGGVPGTNSGLLPGKFEILTFFGLVCRNHPWFRILEQAVAVSGICLGVPEKNSGKIEGKWLEEFSRIAQFRGVPTTPDPNTSAKVSRYKWEPYRDTNWWCIYYFLPRGGHILWQKYAIGNGRCIAILFKSIGVRGRCDSPDKCFKFWDFGHREEKQTCREPNLRCRVFFEVESYSLLEFLCFQRNCM